MTKLELHELSKEIFNANPQTDKLIATNDGNFFLPAAKGLALDYCRKKGVEHQIITKYEVFETQEVETQEVETPAVETPVVETPVVDAPAVDAPGVETPVVDASVVEAPVVAKKSKKKNK